MKKYLNTGIFLAAIIFIGVFFSFRLLSSPPGLTPDEASIGYNAALIAQSGRDETGRKFPFFVLTLKGSDWKQPVSIYSTAIIFKIFGESLFALRFVNVIALLISVFLTYYLSRLLLGKKGAFFSIFIFLTIPAVMMHVHLAQENFMPVLFTLLWLLSLYLYKEKRKLSFLIFSGISLGICLYSYKGMRAIVPLWIISTFAYLLVMDLKHFDRESIKEGLKCSLAFALAVFPFIVIIPYLNTHYAGAVFDSSSIQIRNFYEFIYPYLSSFDISALFLKGDSTVWHSTGLHGVFLIASLPLFLYGIGLTFKKKGFFSFLFLCFFVTPALFGQVNSIHRFSRLLVFIPFFVIFTTLAITELLKMKRGLILISLTTFFILINYFDFLKYYWYQYPANTQDSFLVNTEPFYSNLSKISKDKNLAPYIYGEDIKLENEVGLFYETAYFDQPLGKWKPGDILPEKSILMTRLENQPNMTRLDEGKGTYHYLVNY